MADLTTLRKELGHIAYWTDDDLERWTEAVRAEEQAKAREAVNAIKEMILRGHSKLSRPAHDDYFDLVLEVHQAHRAETRK
jgi:hypothetical protein